MVGALVYNRLALCPPECGHTERRVTSEENVSAEHPQARQDAWLPGPYGDARRSSHPCRPSTQGALCSERLGSPTPGTRR